MVRGGVSHKGKRREMEQQRAPTDAHKEWLLLLLCIRRCPTSNGSRSCCCPPAVPSRWGQHSMPACRWVAG